MGRTDEARLFIDAPPDRVYQAFVSPESLEVWLPPEGMTGRVEHFDARPGGTYRVVLTYAEGSGGVGKSSANEDVTEGIFIEVTPGVGIVHDIEFPSEDHRFAGTMRMTWEAVAEGSGSMVVFRAENVPPGISAEDHAQGLSSSLENLAALIGR